MVTSFLVVVVMVIFAYLCGSVSSAIIVCRLMRLPDPRTEGSRNPGATNVLRIGGKSAAIITMIGDVLKGVIPVLVAQTLELPPYVIACTAFAAFLGHLYPIFFGFVGGKGVATLMGSLLALSFLTGLVFIALWLMIILLTRYVSIASMLACLLTPLSVWYFTHQVDYVVVTLLMAVVVIYRHRNNLVNLMNGTERRIGQKAS